MKAAENNNTKKLNSKAFILFIKIFLVYIFFEYILLSVSTDWTYTYLVKFAGDFMVLALIVYTFVKLKAFKFYKTQSLLLVAGFIILATISTIKNGRSFLDLFVGMRSLFRYYIIFFISYYYDLKSKDFKKISDFIIATFYFEIILFSINYLVFQRTGVLGMSYLPVGIYLNAVFSLVLFRNKLNLKNLVILLLIGAQAFLSTSRLAFVGILLQTIIFIFLAWKKKFLIKFFVFSGILILVALLFLFEPINQQIVTSDAYNKIKDTRFDSESNFRVYLITHFTQQSIEEGNIIGDGPNTFGSQLNEEYNYAQGFDKRTIAYSADSHYTILLMSYGFLGVLFYYFILLMFFLASKPAHRLFLFAYLSFIVLASFALPIFSMRMSSFILFVFFSFAHKKEDEVDRIETRK